MMADRWWTHYKSKISGNLYHRDEYTNHGYLGVKQGYKDLPHNEYPYELVLIK